MTGSKMMLGMKKRRDRGDAGYTMMSVVGYLIVGSILAATIAAIVFWIVSTTRSAADEQTQTFAVQSTIENITRAVDESAGIFRSTETELGVSRNVVSDSGGVDCLKDYYYVEDSGDPLQGTVMRHWQQTETGSCSDIETWDVTAASNSVIVIENLEPFTLVNDTGLATEACTATEDRGEGVRCVPVFRYRGADGNNFDPGVTPIPNSIAAVTVVLTATVADNEFVSRSITVAPDHYIPGTIIGEIAPPLCPASLSRVLDGNNVTLTWAPVPGATEYRITRTTSGTTVDVGTFDPAADPDVSPTFTDNISGISGASVVYQVIPRVNGQWVSGCPQTVISIQVSPPSPIVEVIGSASSNEWAGARTGDGAFSNSTLPILRISWGAVAGANEYQVELREMHPTAGGSMTGWAGIGWNGSNTPSNVVTGTTAETTTWNGRPLWGRAFQVRVRTTSDAGTSPWMYCYMTPSAGDAGVCNQHPTDSFPSETNGYLVFPAPPSITVTSVTAAASGNVSLQWSRSPNIHNAHHNDRVVYQAEFAQRDGTSPSVVYGSSNYEPVPGRTNTALMSGSSTVDRGDWSHQRVRACNSRNPYAWGGLNQPYSGSGSVQCGPYSRVWSALGLPDVPSVAATVNSSTDRNTVHWGKHSSVTTPDYSAQFINYYNVAEQQGGGPGTSVGSGNTSTANDSVAGDALSSPWLSNTTNTAMGHDRREGDFTRYRAMACNVTERNAANDAWVAGVTGFSGVGDGVESCSDWSGDTQRYWQDVGTPTCSVTNVTWNQMRVRITGSDGNGGLYISPLNSVNSRHVIRQNRSESGNPEWSRSVSSGTPWYTWSDDLSSGDAAQGTVKPGTSNRGMARIVTQNAGEGYNSNCSTVTIPNPPVPNRPSVSVTGDGIDSRATPYVRKSWSVASNVSSGVTQRRESTGASWASTSNSGAFVTTSTWGTTSALYVRSAHTPRLASWGWWSPVGSASVSVSTGGSRCPVPDYTWAAPVGVVNTWEFQLTTTTSSYCQYTVYAGEWIWQTLVDYYRNQVDNTCALPIFPSPVYCDPERRRDDEARSRASSSSYTQRGDAVATFRFTYGSSEIGPHAYSRVSHWPVSHPTHSYPVGVTRPGGWPYSGTWPLKH